MRYFSLILLLGLSVVAPAAIENFDDATWLHHQALGQQVLTDDLVISVDVGASMKGVLAPNALQPGFDRSRPTEKLVIEPRNTQTFTLNGFVATDLFQMAEPSLKVEGFRDGVLVATQLTGQLWDDANRNGVLVALADFEDVDRVEMSSNVTAPAMSDVFFFLESLAYAYPGEAAPASPFGFGNGGTFSLDNLTGSSSGGGLSIFTLLLVSMLLFARGKMRRS